MSFRNFTAFVFAASLVALTPTATLAQQNVTVDAVKKRAELNSAKADLEEARRKRDMAVAARWKDRETFNKERELFNEKYQLGKERVDALMSERTRLLEDVRVAREDLAQVKLQAEKARAEYLSLADDPLRIARSMLEVAKKEMKFTREVRTEKADLMFGSSVAEGDRMRLGGLFAMQMAKVTDVNGFHPSALMLPVAGEKKRVYSWQENLSPETRKDVAKAFAGANDSAFVMVPVDVLLSTELSSELANHQETTWKEDFAEFFHNVCILMYPIATLFILGLIIFLVRLGNALYPRPYHLPRAPCLAPRPRLWWPWCPQCGKGSRKSRPPSCNG